MNKENITIHNEKDFRSMRAAGKLAAQTLDFIIPHVKPGITTDKLNTLCHDFTMNNSAIPGPLHYKGFPKSICTSVNHVVCHGIPSEEKVLKEGDIINIDVTPVLDGWYGDTSRMFYVGQPSIKAKRLIAITYQSMMKGIDCVKPGTKLGDIGHAIQAHAEKHNFSVVRQFCGHGVGKVFHESPNILHYGNPGEGIALREGMIFTIEPMINAGKYDVKILEDQWTAVTRDRSLSAQFEHSIGVTKDGFEIFTLSPKGYDYPPYGD